MNGNIRHKGKEIPMVLSRMSWSLYSSLYRLRESLINNDEFELADRLVGPMNSFWFYSLFSGSSTLLTVAGPQGVGKSLMVNTLLQLPKDARLPVDEISCEHIPVVLMHVDRNDPRYKKTNPVEVYQKTEPNSNEFFKMETMSYEEGRKRAIKPKENDLVIIWRVFDNPLLQRLSPIAVLPGLEIKAPWEKAIKFILDVSDVVIYTLDNRRMAQDTAAQIEKWIKKSKLAVEPITVITKSETIGEKERNSIVKTMSEHGFNPIFIDSLSEKGAIGYKKLSEAITGSLVNVPIGIQTEKLKDILSYKVAPILKEIEPVADERAKSINFEDNLIIKKAIEKLDETWEKEVRQIILDKAEKSIGEHVNKAVDSARKVAKKEFTGTWKKIELWFSGGPDIDSIIRIENVIRDELFSNLNRDISTSIENALSSQETQIQYENIDKKNWAPMSLMTILTTPINKVEVTVDDLKKSFARAHSLNESMLRFFKSSIQDAKEFVQETRAFVNLLRTESVNTALATALFGSGVIEASAEAAGGGLVVGSGVTSVIAGIAGVAVAAVSAISLYADILRSSRRMEWEVEKYIRELTRNSYDMILEEFERRLDRFWDIFKFHVRENLRQRIGLDDRLKNSIELYDNLKDAKDTVKGVLVKIGI